MASYCEPMDVDEVPVDSDDKENAFRHNGPGAAPRTPRDKICEDLDVSEVNMKLRMSCTPLLSSAQEKHFKGSVKKLFPGSEEADSLNIIVADNADITMAEWSMNDLNSSDSTGEPDCTYSGNNTESYYKNETAALNATTRKAKSGGDLSYPQSQEIPKVTSPILKGISSVLNMFRPSQSPICSRNDIRVDIRDDRTPDTTINSVQISTPVTDGSKNKRKSYQSASKIGPNSNKNIIFNEDLINDLQWNDDSTIIFNTEKMPDNRSSPSSNSEGFALSIDSHSETDKNPTEEGKLEIIASAVVPDTTVEKIDMPMNCSNFEYSSQFQENYNDKLFAEKELQEIIVTAGSVLESVIEEAQKLVEEPFTKERNITNRTTVLDDNFCVENLEASQHAEDYTKDSEEVITENIISQKDNISSILMLNPMVLHSTCEINSFDNENDISCQPVTNVSEKDLKVTIHSNIDMSRAPSATHVMYEVDSSAKQTPNLKAEITQIESGIVNLELCNNEENCQKLVAQANQGECINEEIATSQNTSPFISLNAPDKNIELESPDSNQQLDYNSIENPFATVLKIKLSPSRSDVNFEEIKHPFTPKAIISKTPLTGVSGVSSGASTKIENSQAIQHTLIDTKIETNYADEETVVCPLSVNYEADANAILHSITVNIDAHPNEVSLSLQGSENFANAMESLSEFTPSGSDIVQGENSDAYLSADSGRESEQLLDIEVEQIDKEREVITPTTIINNHDENETICLSPNYSKMLLTGYSHIENSFDTKIKISMSPSGIPNNSVRENDDVYAVAENVPEKMNEVASPTLSINDTGETVVVISEKISTEAIVKPNKELVLDNSPLPELKQELGKKEEAFSDGNGENLTNFQPNRAAILTHEVIADSSEFDGSSNVTKFEKLGSVQVNEVMKLNAIKNKAEICAAILSIDEKPHQKIERISALDEVSEKYFTTIENPFATRSRLSKSPSRSIKDFDSTSDTRIKAEILPPITPPLPITEINKELEIIHAFSTTNKVRTSLCENEIAEKHEIINDVKFCGERQDTAGHLDTGKEKYIDNKSDDVKESSQANKSISSEISPDGNVTVREVHTDDEDTMEGPALEEDLDNSLQSITQVKSPSKDHNKSEIKPLQVIMCDDIASNESAVVDLPPEEDFMQCRDEEFRPGELFINADTFEFLMSQGTAHVTDYGKESLFLKFDPLCARRSSVGTNDISMKLNSTVLHHAEVIPEESPITQTEILVKSHKTRRETVTSTPENPNTIREKTSTPENLNTTTDLISAPESFNDTRYVISGSANFDTTRNVTYAEYPNTIRNVTSAPEYLNFTGDVTEILENLNITIDAPTSMLNMCSNEKPTMAVPPSTVSNETSVVNRSAPYTPIRTERRSMTFSSPAIAAIDRLISLSGNNSPVTQNYYVDNTMSQETREAIAQIQDLLAAKEAEVNQLKQESKELQDKLVDLDIQMKSVQEDNDERLRKIEDLKAKVAHKTAMNNNMSATVAEYERAVASMIADNEEERKRYELEKANLIRERDEQISHLSSMEGSFSDLHTKYERTKQLVLTFKVNEEILRRTINEYKARTEKLEHNYESLKQQANNQLNNANIELDKVKRSHEAEVLKLNAQIRRKELHVASLEESLAQKIKANEELTAICDEIISKVG